VRALCEACVRAAHGSRARGAGINGLAIAFAPEQKSG